MEGDSRPVRSSQHEVHPRLEEVVRRHRVEPYRRPIPDHTLQAFERVAASVDPRQAVIIDAGCGTGESTLKLAERFPGSQVVGIDRSAQRLARSGCEDFLKRDNAILVRADVGDFWRLALGAGWRCLAHYLLYPNPWPKPRQLMRRWHAHPAFPALIGLGGALELRTNWRVYGDEFRLALHYYGLNPSRDRAMPGDYLSPFERKYNLSGHDLYRVRCNLEERERERT